MAMTMYQNSGTKAIKGRKIELYTVGKKICSFMSHSTWIDIIIISSFHNCFPKVVNNIDPMMLLHE